MKKEFIKSIIGIFVLAIILGSIPIYADTTRVKSYIGNGDIKWWDGINNTFTRRTSTGGLLTLNAVGASVDVAEVYGNGSASWAALSTAISTISSNDRALYLKPGTWDLAANLTVPTNVTLVTVPGTILQVGNGSTLTINGRIQAGIHQIFSCVGTGAVVFGDGYVTTLYPEWWGADQAALQSCLTASAKKTVYFSKKDWAVTASGDPLNALTMSNITGAQLVGETGAKIINSTLASRLLTITDCTDITIKNIFFEGPNGTPWDTDALPWVAGAPHGFMAYEAGVYIDGTSSNIIIDQCKFLKFAEVAICGYSASSLTVTNTNFVGITGITPTGLNSHRYCVGVWCRDGRLVATNNDMTNVTYGFVTENSLGSTDTRHNISYNTVELADFATCGIYANWSYNSSFCYNVFTAADTACLHDGTIKIRAGRNNKVIGNSLRNGIILLSSTLECDVISNTVEYVLNTVSTFKWSGIHTSNEDAVYPSLITIANNTIRDIGTPAACINLTSGMTLTSVIGNKMQVAATGISVNNTGDQSLSYISIMGNLVYDADYGIYVTCSATKLLGYITITNNIIYGSGGITGIAFSPSASGQPIVKMFNNQVLGFTNLYALNTSCNNVITNEYVQNITDNDALLLTGVETTNFTNTGAVDDAYTLADGVYEGQRKILRAVSITGAGDVVITPTTFESTTITLNAAKQSVELMWTGSSWRVVVNNGGTIA